MYTLKHTDKPQALTHAQRQRQAHTQTQSAIDEHTYSYTLHSCPFFGLTLIKIAGHLISKQQKSFAAVAVAVALERRVSPWLSQTTQRQSQGEEATSYLPPAPPSLYIIRLVITCPLGMKSSSLEGVKIPILYICWTKHSCHHSKKKKKKIDRIESDSINVLVST